MSDAQPLTVEDLESFLNLFRKIMNEFYKDYALKNYRNKPSDKIPAAHQIEALERLHEWFREQRDMHSGGILVLPTGGGKTFTTLRFVCTSPLSKGYKVLWLAHTHHLLEQAFYALESEVKHISLPQTRLQVRVVSGTPGHYSVDKIGIRDNVLIATLQTLTRAYKRKQPQLEAFLESANDKLFVVFDEAHHSPSPTYRQLIIALQERFPKMYLLGLTATPTYSNQSKYGWLEKLFPQRILYQVTAQQLMGDGILSKPEIEQHKTNFEAPEFEAEEYKKWTKSYQDLPEDIISKLAENRDRNAFIAETYASNKERYGKTIIFADRWFQCEQLREFLENRGIRAGVLYSGAKSSEGEKVPKRDEKTPILEAFRRNDFDVLINIKILTEGTDIPEVQTVFITRETTSDILLTQMIGRALRGPRMGGTEKAYIVAFIDNWKYEIKWAGYRQIIPGIADNDASESHNLSPQVILADLVRRLAQQMDITIDNITGPFLTLLPLGWYKVEFETVAEGSEDDIRMTELVMVFEGEKDAYERFIESIAQAPNQEFAEIDLNFDEKYQSIKELCIKAFYEQDITAEIVGEWPNESVLINLFHIARHVAQNEGEKPPFFLFEERDNHDLDALAQKFVNDDLGPRALEQALQVEFERKDRYWKTIYYSYELFKEHYNACVNKLLAKESISVNKPDLPPAENLKMLPNSQVVEIEKKPQQSKEVDVLPETKEAQLSSDLPMPKQISSLEQWKDFVCNSINIFYGCDVVQSFKVLGSDKYTSWKIGTERDIDSDLIKPHLEYLMQKIQTFLVPRGYIPPERIFVNHVSVERKTHSGWRTDSLRARPIRSAQTEWILNSLHTDNQNKIASAGITEVSLNSSNEDINSSAVTLEVSENIEIDPQNFLLRYANGERDFHELKLTGVNNGLKLAGVNISGINLSRANLCLTNMFRTNLSEANLTGVNLVQANLSEANLTGTNLIKAALQYASLSAANLQNANLSGANLQNANLNRANLQNANLSGANLQNANLSEANLQNANLSETNLQKANLFNAIMPNGEICNQPNSSEKPPIMILENAAQDTSTILSEFISTLDKSNRTLIETCISRGKVEILKSLDGNYDLLIMCPTPKVPVSVKFYSLTSNYQHFVGNFGKIMICTTRDRIELIANSEINYYEDFDETLWTIDFRHYALMNHKSHNWYIIIPK